MIKHDKVHMHVYEISENLEITIELSWFVIRRNYLNKRFCLNSV